MSGKESLKEVYISELQDLWSANDQMQRVMKELSSKAADPKLKKTMEQSATGISTHTETLKSLLKASGGSVSKEHCKGMEGLTKEARKHAIDEELGDDARDLEIVAQYQRMSHYGLAGFGTAAAYAKALGLKDDASKLKSAVADIYKADEYATHLAETATKLAAKAA